MRQSIAKTLGWSLEEVNQFSLAALRDLVRPIDPHLAEQISRTIQLGDFIQEDGS